MILKCSGCGRSDDLSPLRIGRKHGNCGFSGKWLEVERAPRAPQKASKGPKGHKGSNSGPKRGRSTPK